MGNSAAKKDTAAAAADADAGDKRKASVAADDEDSGAAAPATKKAKGNAGGASPTKTDAAKGKKKAAAEKKEKVAPFSWDDFKANAHPLDVKFGADSKDVRRAAVKQFATGSYGWSYHGNEVFAAAPQTGGKTVAARVGLIVTIANSKPKGGKDEKATEDDAADDGAESATASAAAGSADKEYRELAKADCPFASSDEWLKAAKALTVKFGAAGAPANATSVVPFDVSAAPKAFATGSFGWMYSANKKIEAHSDAAHGVQTVTVRVQLNITLANSKSASAKPKKAAGKGKGKK